MRQPADEPEFLTKPNRLPDSPNSGTRDPRPPAGRGRTRLAPSPTGALHLGNALSLLVTWAIARRRGWSVVLRIEDLDTPRVKPGRIEEARETLSWLGITWDEEAPLQSTDLDPCRDAMGRLAGAGLVYPCERTRAEIEEAAAAISAPQEGSGEVRCPPQLRPPKPWPTSFNRTDVNWRFAVPPGSIEVRDELRGTVMAEPARTVGDFVVWTARGAPAYQLAVVVDDTRQGVTAVVRGSDLLDSAARQMLLMRAAGLGPPPLYAHHPLVRGPDGRRLAKRHGDTRIATYREAGVAPERIVGLVARWAGVAGEPHGGGAPRRAMTPAEFAARLDVSTMPLEDIVFREEDDAWLRSDS